MKQKNEKETEHAPSLSALSAFLHLHAFRHGDQLVLGELQLTENELIAMAESVQMQKS